MNVCLARYRLSVRITETLRLPDYAGSTLRGAFGHALMQLSGISKADVAQKTPLFLQSPYAHIFDPQASDNKTGLKGAQHTPVPYVIEAPLTGARAYQPGETLTFHLILTGAALAHLATIILAWRRAFLRGIGQGDGKAELVLVEHESSPDSWQAVFSKTQPLLLEHNTLLALPDYAHPQDVHLLLQTPLRLQSSGKIIGPKEANASFFLRNLIRRVTVQLQQHSKQSWTLEDIRHLNTLADSVTDDRRLRWQEWGRYSSRQQQAMKLGGIVGRWHFNNVPAELLPFIHLGQWLHLGKEVAFGLGKYQRLDEPWNPSHLPASQACQIN